MGPEINRLSSFGAGRGYGSSWGLPSCDDWCTPWLDAWLLQVLGPSFKHGLNGQAFLLSDVVSFCRGEACGEIKHKISSRMISDKVWLSMVLPFIYKALTTLKVLCKQSGAWWQLVQTYHVGLHRSFRPQVVMNKQSLWTAGWLELVSGRALEFSQDWIGVHW